MDEKPRRRPGRPKGLPKTGGRKKGSTDRLTEEVRDIARGLLDETYRKALKDRLARGVAGSIEPKLWEYGYGKTREVIDLALSGETVHVHEHFYADRDPRLQTPSTSA